MAEVLTVGVTAQDSASPVMERFRKQIIDTSSGLDKFGQSLQDQASKIPGLSNATGVLSNAVKLLKNPYVEVAAVMGATTTAIIHFTEANTANVMALTRMHAATGLTVNSLAALKKIGQDTETPIESLTSGVGKLEKNLTSHRKELEKVGVTSHEPLEALAQLSDAFTKIHDPVERARIGNLALGKSWQDLAPLLDQGGASIRKAAEASSISDGMVQRYKTIHGYQVQITQASSAWKSALGDLGSVVLEPILQKMAGIAGEAKSIAKNLKDALGADANKDLYSNFMNGMQAKAKGGTATASTGAFTSNFDAEARGSANSGSDRLSSTGATKQVYSAQEFSNRLATLDLEGQKTVLEQAIRNYESFATKVSGVSIANLVVQRKKINDEITKPARVDSGDTKKKTNQLDDYLKKIGYTGDAKDTDLHSETGYNYQGYDADLQAQLEHTKELAERYHKAQEEETRAHNKRMQDLIDKAGKLGVGYSTNDSADDLDKKIQQAEALKKATDKAVELAKKNGQELNQVLTRTASNLSTPFESFYKHIGSSNKSLSGSFKQLFSDIEDSFGNMLAQMITQLTEKAAIFGVLNLLSGGGITSATSALSSFSWFASGTDYAPGGPAIVGENGPEAVYLPQGSRVIPNHALSSATATGGDATYNVHINGSNLTKKDISNTVVSSFKTLQKQNSWRRGN